MKKLASLIVVVAMIAGIAYMNYSFEKPFLTIKVAQTPVEVTEGTYCWNHFTSSECVDMMSPTQMIDENYLVPTAVKPGATLTYTFSRTPLKDSVELLLWEQNDEKKVPLNKNVFRAPKKQGTYVYSISARWENGDASYIFAIQVK